MTNAVLDTIAARRSHRAYQDTPVTQEQLDALLAACLQNGCHIAVDSDAHSTWQLRHGLTALYGFPCDAIITEMTCNSLSDDKIERSYLMANMFPSMIVGGFVTVTITSVLLAGYFATLL